MGVSRIHINTRQNLKIKMFLKMLMVHHLKAFNTKNLLNENLKIKMDELIHPPKNTPGRAFYSSECQGH